MNKRISGYLSAKKGVPYELRFEREWLFVDDKGTILSTGGYHSSHARMIKRLKIKPISSYAYKRGIKNKLEKAGIAPSERAAILGHTFETNIKYYTFAIPKYIEDVKKVLN